MEPGVLERDRRLVAEEREDARVGRAEVVDPPGAVLLVGDDEEAERTAVRRDRDGEELLGGGARERRRPVLPAVADEDPPFRVGSGPVVDERRPDAPDEDLGLSVGQGSGPHDERPAPRVQERDGLHQDLVRERFEVEGPGDRESDVVEALQLPHPVLQLEVGLPDLLRHPHPGEEGGGVRRDGGEAAGILRSALERDPGERVVPRRQRDDARVEERRGPRRVRAEHAREQGPVVARHVGAAGRQAERELGQVSRIRGDSLDGGMATGGRIQGEAPRRARPLQEGVEDRRQERRADRGRLDRREERVGPRDVRAHREGSTPPHRAATTAPARAWGRSARTARGP